MFLFYLSCLAIDQADPEDKAKHANYAHKTLKQRAKVVQKAFAIFPCCPVPLSLSDLSQRRAGLASSIELDALWRTNREDETALTFWGYCAFG